MVVTKEHIALAKASGACAEEVKRLRPGKDISLIPCESLAWAENVLPKSLQREAIEDALSSSVVIETGDVLLSLLGCSGYGSGSGDGYGYGSGDGYGYGSGSGDGDGDGYGYGSGSGSGDGYGYGYGDGYGYGSGSGDGYGYGYGSGSGDGSGR